MQGHEGVDGDDFLIWQRQLGCPPPVVSSSTNLAVTATVSLLDWYLLYRVHLLSRRHAAASELA